MAPLDVEVMNKSTFTSANIAAPIAEARGNRLVGAPLLSLNLNNFDETGHV